MTSFLYDRRFSFLYNEQAINTYAVSVTQYEEENHTVTEYRFQDGLCVTNILTFYPEHGAYEWVNTYENTAKTVSGRLTEIFDCDITLPMDEETPAPPAFQPERDAVTRIFSTAGSNVDKFEFGCDVDDFRNFSRPNHISIRQTKQYAPHSGRSSEGTAPFFNINKGDDGCIFAVGWTGQWNVRITREARSLRFCSGIEQAAFRLYPGEKIRGSSIVVLPYHCDVDTAQNRFRRLMRDRFSPVGANGRVQYAPFSASIWGGMHSSSMLERIALIKENNLPFEYFWIDAGWYGIDTHPSPHHGLGDWYTHTGDWRPSPLIHPNGMHDVSDAVHSAGLKFLLWLEPERVLPYAPITQEHPEYFLSHGWPEDENLMLNLGDEAAHQYIQNTIIELIESLNIDCLRIDFNCYNALARWRDHDSEDRQGITEIRYITGLYQLLDNLLEIFPNLIIDSCASGGKRIDMEMLRRTIPLWRTDYACNLNCYIEGIQNHHLNFNRWLPFSGTGCGTGCDEYRIRSSYDSAMMCYHTYIESDTVNTPEIVSFLKLYGEEYIRVRPYFSEDFYPLTEPSGSLDTWSACQFHRPCVGDGLIQAFRREKSPFEAIHVFLRGIDESRIYQFEDLDGGTFTVSGDELARNGIRLTILEQRKAKLWIYRPIDNSIT